MKKTPARPTRFVKRKKIGWFLDFLPKMKHYKYNACLTGDVTQVNNHNSDIPTLDAKVSNNCIY